MSQGDTKCPKCQEAIQPNAKKCKHCGADLRNWFLRHKIISVLLALLLLGLIGSLFSKDDGNTTVPSQSTNTEEVQPTKTEEVKKPEETVLKISAKQLFADYKANEIAADGKYKGKLLEITGTVETLGKDIINDPYVALQSGELISSVQCMLKDGEETRAATLSKGDTITLRGRGASYLVNVLIRDCTFVTP